MGAHAFFRVGFAFCGGFSTTFPPASRALVFAWFLMNLRMLESWMTAVSSAKVSRRARVSSWSAAILATLIHLAVDVT